MSWQFNRAHYRIEYPERERPRFATADTEFVVVDCSERGFRYRSPAGPHPEIGTIITGTLVFRGQREVMVEGEVVRHDKTDIALRLSGPGIPLAIILDEQRYLRSRYPTRF